MSINISGVAEMGVELEFDTSNLTGGWDLLGTLAHTPVEIVFDNQSDVEVKVGNNASDTWQTYVSGEAHAIDSRANHGIADNFGFSKGMPIYIKGTAGDAGKYFRVSYIYARV